MQGYAADWYCFGRGLSGCHDGYKATIPSYTTILKSIVRLYKTTRENIKTILKDKILILTTDRWTSLATHAYESQRTVFRLMGT